MAELLGTSLPLLMFVAGVALMAAEALMPGAHFIVVGIALAVAGLVGLVVAPLATPIALAAVTLLVGGMTLWAYLNLDLYEGKDRGQPLDSDALKGAEGRVTERVTAEGGEVKLMNAGFNPYFRARSVDEEIPEGTEVFVLDPGGGNVVTVAPLSGLEDDIDRELAAERARSAAEEAADAEPLTESEGGSDATEPN